MIGQASKQSKEINLQADPTEKLELIETTLQPELRRWRFCTPDKLLVELRMTDRKGK